MKYLKKFENYANVVNRPQQSPDTRPSTPTTKPGVRPTTRPSRPRITPQHNPGVEPAPKAELEDVLKLLSLTASDGDKKEINDHYAKQGE